MQFEYTRTFSIYIGDVCESKFIHMSFVLVWTQCYKIDTNHFCVTFMGNKITTSSVSSVSRSAQATDLDGRY